jgi:uncharacterized protein YxjI
MQDNSGEIYFGRFMQQVSSMGTGDITSLGLTKMSSLQVKQIREMAELLGFETRNKYQISDENGQPIGFAAEQQKGFWGFIFRMFLGHWRRFSLHIFDSQRNLVMQAEHPFRFIFQRLEIKAADGRALGNIQQRFAIFSKRFDLEDTNGRLNLEVSSPLWKLWAFEFKRQGKVVAAVKKRWSGALSEIFTDRDNFLVEYSLSLPSQEERALVLAAAIFIDLQYFEAKAG